MAKYKPSLFVATIPYKFKFLSKLVLGVLSLSLFLNYHPAFAFPPIKENTVNAQEQVQQTQEVKSESVPIVFQLPHPGYITTHFSSYHPGIDICTGLGMPIKPIAKGTVVEASFNFWGLGLVVEVEHAEGFRSLYAHMGKIYVQKGQEVDTGTFLGEVGMTGHTTGPHTHLELSKDGQKINPLPLLPEIRSYPTESDFVKQESSTPSAVLIPSYPSTASATLSAYLPTSTPEPTPSPTPTPTPTPLALSLIEATPTPEPLIVLSSVTPPEEPSLEPQATISGGELALLLDLTPPQTYPGVPEWVTKPAAKKSFTLDTLSSQPTQTSSATFLTYLQY